MADIVDRIKGDEIRWLKLHVVDVEGYLRSMTLNARILSEQPLKKGFPAPSIAEAFGRGGDVIAFPMEETYALLPWEERSARMLAHLGHPNGEAYAKDPYHAFVRALEGLEALGLSLKAEQRLEFYFFDNIAVDREHLLGGVALDGRELPWSGTNRYIEDRTAAAVPFDMYSILREQIGDVLNLYFSTPVVENGHGKGAGQQYLRIGIGEGKAVAFDFINAKFVAKMVGMLNGSLATFMPYPLRGQAPSRWQLDVSLWKGKEEDEESLLYFIGGVVDHLESLAVFTNPTTNSYRALKASPKFGVVSTHRSGAVWVREKHGKRTVTLTFPDTAVNPYIALAAVIGAGIDGIRKKTAPEIIEEDPAKMTSRERQRAHIGEMPSSIGEAVKALNSDSSYLKGIFSAELLASYLERKLMDEREDRLTPTTYEWAKYSEL